MNTGHFQFQNQRWFWAKLGQASTRRHNDAEDACGALTVSLGLAVCSRRENGGVPGKRGGRPRKGAEDLQISSHCLLAKVTLFAANTRRSSERKEGAKRNRALCNILSGSSSAASRPRPYQKSCCYVTSHFPPFLICITTCKILTFSYIIPLALFHLHLQFTLLQFTFSFVICIICFGLGRVW